MNILSNIIRGGQLSLHALRMFQQVAHYIAIIFLLIVICVAGYNINERFQRSQYQYLLQEYRDYHIANLMCQTQILCNKDMRVSFGKNSIKVRAKNIVTSKHFQGSKDEVDEILKESIEVGLKAGLWVLLIISSFLIRKGFKKSGQQHMRGAEIKGFKEISKKIRRANFMEFYKAYKIANMPYPYQAECQHTLVMGSNGVGKTVLISDLVEQIRRRGEKAIIYDKKGDYIKWFYDESKDFILNPFDKRGKEWNLLREIGDIGTIKQIAKAFIPEKGTGQGESAIWDEAGRIAFTGVVEKLYSKGELCSNREIVDKILRVDIKKAAKLVEGTYAAATLGKDSPRTAASVLFVLASHFNSLRLTGGKYEDSFSIRDWVLGENQDSMLFITSLANLSEELIPLQSAWLEIATNSILSKEDGREKTWMILDELPTLGKIPSLQQGLAVSRSYGGCFVLGMQNIAQMREKYGRNATQDISSECNTRCIFKNNDPDTARWLADNIGQAEAREFKEGLSYGANTIRDGVTVNVQEKVRNVLLPSEIQNLERLELYLKMPDYQAVRTKLKYKERRVGSKAFIKNEELSVKLKEIYQNIDDSEGNEGNEGKNEEDIKQKKLDFEHDVANAGSRDGSKPKASVNASVVKSDNIEDIIPNNRGSEGSLESQAAKSDQEEDWAKFQDLIK